MKVLLLVSLLLTCLVCQAEIYKWVDENGRTHYSDSKPETETAETVDVKVNTYTNVTIDDSVFYREEAPTRVVMYSTSWCGYCKKARRYFQKNNIPFTEYDIEKNNAARKRYDKLGGKGVPVILAGNKRMNGFSESGFEKIYNQ